MRTSNPTLKEDTFSDFGYVSATAEPMTIDGTVRKTGILLCCVLATAYFTWSQFAQGNVALANGWMIIGAIGGLILALITIFKKNIAAYTAPLYALCQGLFLGGISAAFEAKMPGIVFTAVGLTFGTMAALLLAFTSGMIKVTDGFRMGITAATGGIALFYLISICLGFFGIQVPLIHQSGIFGIGFSLFVVAIAALNLVLDFDLIEKGANYGAPKYMEWYCAFGLMVTLIWLYIEVLRLLAKLRDNR